MELSQARVALTRCRGDFEVSFDLPLSGGPKFGPRPYRPRSCSGADKTDCQHRIRALFFAVAGIRRFSAMISLAIVRSARLPAVREIVPRRLQDARGFFSEV